MNRIMFVCHGNICRSPMAEFILRNLAERESLDLVIASSATSTEEIRNGIGNPVYPLAKSELLKHGILCEGKRAVQLQCEDYKKYDLFVGMDSTNIRNMYRILRGDPDNKIRKLMDFTERPGDVSDPWYSDRFDIAFRDIYEGCCGLISFLKNEIPQG